MLVYLIQNIINDKCYIGKTVGTIDGRWSAHVYEAMHGSQIIFHRAIRKYGPEAFKLTTVCYADSHEELYSLEQATIAAFRACGADLYNLTDGGPGSYGLKHSETTKAKLADIARNMFVETRAKIGSKSKGHRYALGHVPSVVARAAMGRSMRGKKHSQATRDKMSATQNKPEVKNKNSQAHIGKKHNQATKTKMSKSAKGKPKSAAHCAAIRESKLGNKNPGFKDNPKPESLRMREYRLRRRFISTRPVPPLELVA